MGENHAPNTNPKIAKSQANCRILIESKYNTQATEINYKTAYETATELSTQSYIGLMYANGQGVPEDDAEAMKWLPCGQKIKTAGKTRGYPIPA